MEDIRVTEPESPNPESVDTTVEPTPDAPYGYKADGTPKKKPGRPSKSEPTVNAADETPKATVIPLKAPEPKRTEKRTEKPEKLSASESALREIDAREQPTGWFSRDADSLRCERAKFAARHWFDAARFAVATGEGIARSAVAQKLYEKGHSPESIERTLKKAPHFRDVAIEFAGQKTDCETVNAQAIAFIAGYFIPATPDHPLAQAGIALVSSFVAYNRALEKALQSE